MLRRASICLACTCLSACGGGGTTTDGTETGAATVVDTTEGPATTGSTTSDTTVEPTTAAATTGEPTTGEPTTGEPTTTTGTTEETGSTTEASSDTTTGGLADCSGLLPGPLMPELVWSGYNGSEDLGFDGEGRLALKRGDKLVLVTAGQQETVLLEGLPQVYGTRVAVGGDFVLALPGEGSLIAVTPAGDPSIAVANLSGPNGVYIDPTGGVWVTEFGGSRVIRLDADFKNKKTIYQGPAAVSANGVVLDLERELLFFTSYGAGRLLKLPLDGQGEPLGEPVEVASVQGAKLDGLALDACGNVYAVDQGNSRLYRARLDGEAELDGEIELLAEFAENVANAQFGVGEGFDPMSLYLAGNPGDVYRVAVGVPGAAIGLP